MKPRIGMRIAPSHARSTSSGMPWRSPPTINSSGAVRSISSGAKKIALDGLHKDDWVAVDADRRGATVVATYIEVVDDPNDPGDDE